jgi:hypothetical protein
MKIEHKLAPAVAEYAAEAVRQLGEIRRQYLELLGQAKELEIAAETVRRALQQQLALVEQTEGLPKPVSPYTLSPDCSKLVGELPPEDPAAAPVTRTVDLAAIGGNGIDHA